MPYRVEEASTGRAGCKNKECQDRKDKILKGELRLGSWVETESFQSWAWKHWGCVTPKQISNLQATVGDDKEYSLLDGYDEVSEENQEKIREAISQGHVDDSDWRGDVEMNRPGKSGFRVRVSKKKKKQNDGEAKEDSKEDDKPAKPRGKATKESEDEEDEEAVAAPKKGKAAAASKKRKKEISKESGDDEGLPKSKGAKHGRKSGKPSKDDAPSKSSKSADTDSSKASRARRAADRAARKA